MTKLSRCFNNPTACPPGPFPCPSVPPLAFPSAPLFIFSPTLPCHMKPHELLPTSTVFFSPVCYVFTCCQVDVHCACKLSAAHQQASCKLCDTVKVCLPAATGCVCQLCTFSLCLVANQPCKNHRKCSAAHQQARHTIADTTWICLPGNTALALPPSCTLAPVSHL